MSVSPIFKLYDSDGEYRAACKYIEDAACLVSFLGDGSTIRYGHLKKDTVWKEGPDGDGYAGNSYDLVAIEVNRKLLRASRSGISIEPMGLP